MLAFQARALQAGLDLLGEACLLDGVDCGKVVFERGVVLSKGNADRADDNHPAQADVMTIARVHEPRPGQRVTHPEGVFRLGRRVEDNGHAVSFIVTEVAA